MYINMAILFQTKDATMTEDMAPWLQANLPSFWEPNTI